MTRKLKFTEQKEEKKLRLDLGAGKGLSTPDGFEPVDIRPGSGITVVDLTKRWPWKSGAVDEVRCHYLLQMFNAAQRKHFVNELHRVLKPGAEASICVPHWCSGRAYMDIDAAWPPISEPWFFMLDKAQRDAQPYEVVGYQCDFEVRIGFGMHHAIVTRNAEYQQLAVGFWKEAVQDLYATLVKRG